MKILHTADLHLGVKFKNVIPRPKYGEYPPIDIKSFINSRTLDNFSKAVEYAIQHDVKLFIIAGDIFETLESSLEYHTELIKRLKPLLDSDIKIIIIGGNHDYVRSYRKKISLALLEDLNYEGIFFKSSLDIAGNFKNDHPLKFEIDNANVSVALLPYFWAFRREYPQYIKKYIDKMVGELKNTDYKILTAHLDVLGAQYRDEDLIGSFRTIEKIPLSTLYPEYFDYIALGHIHVAQKVGYSSVWYSGSLNKLNFGEYRDNKVFLCIEFKRNINVRKVEIDPINMHVYRINLDNVSHTWSNIRRRLEEVFEYNNMYNSIIKLILKTRSSGDYRNIVSSYGDKIRELSWNYGVAGIYIKPDITGVSKESVNQYELDIESASIRVMLEKYINDKLPYDKEFKKAIFNEALKYIGYENE